MSINTDMTALADAIRAKAGLADKLSVKGMTTAVANIVINPGGDIDLTGVTVTADKMLEGIVAIGADGKKVTGNIQIVAASSDGETVTVPAGFHESSKSFPVSGSSDLSFVTATASDILEGKIGADVDGNPVNGTIQTVTASLTDNVVIIPAGHIRTAQTLTVAEMAEPSVSANVVTIAKGYNKSAKTVSIAKASATLSANVVTIPAGYHDANTVTVPEAGAVSVSGNVVTIPAGYNTTAQTVTVGTAKAAQTYTPSTADQTIAAGTYLSGVQTIKGDANLIADNIAEGVEIFGITGTHQGDSDTEVTFGYIDKNNRFQAIDVSVFPPVDTGGAIDADTVSFMLPKGVESFVGNVLTYTVTDVSGGELGHFYSEPHYVFELVKNADGTFDLATSAGLKRYFYFSGYGADLGILLWYANESCYVITPNPANGLSIKYKLTGKTDILDLAGTYTSVDGTEQITITELLQEQPI